MAVRAHQSRRMILDIGGATLHAGSRARQARRVWPQLTDIKSADVGSTVHNTLTVPGTPLKPPPRGAIKKKAPEAPDVTGVAVVVSLAELVALHVTCAGDTAHASRACVQEACSSQFCMSRSSFSQVVACAALTRRPPSCIMTTGHTSNAHSGLSHSCLYTCSRQRVA